jgi:hypothetical protein
MHLVGIYIQSPPPKMYTHFHPLNADLYPIHHLLALAGAHHFVDVSRVRVNRWYLCIVIEVELNYHYSM